MAGFSRKDAFPVTNQQYQIENARSISEWIGLVQYCKLIEDRQSSTDPVLTSHRPSTDIALLAARMYEVGSGVSPKVVSVHCLLCIQ